MGPRRLGRLIVAAGAAGIAGLATSAPSTGGGARHHSMTVRAGVLTLRAVRAGRGPTVVLLHGYGESLLSWQPVFDRLEGEADVVALDLPGFGLSSKPAGGYANDSLAGTILRAMDALGIGRAVLVGHSLGGAISVAAALAAPSRVRGLVLVDPAVVEAAWLRGAATASETTRRTVRRGVAEYEMLRVHFAGVHDSAWLAESDSDMAYLPSGDPAYRVALQSVLREFDFAYLTPERAARLRLPILLLWGAYDPTVSVEQGRALARALPTSELQVIGRSWHRPHIERPLEVAERISGFLHRLRE